LIGTGIIGFKAKRLYLTNPVHEGSEKLEMKGEDRRSMAGRKPARDPADPGPSGAGVQIDLACKLI
jgi:hypothetical protein